MKRSKFTDEQILAIVKEGEKFRLLCDRGRGELRGGEAARHPGPGLGDVVDTRGAARCRERLRWEPGAAGGGGAEPDGAYLDSSVKRKNETEVQPVV